MNGSASAASVPRVPGDPLVFHIARSPVAPGAKNDSWRQTGNTGAQTRHKLVSTGLRHRRRTTRPFSAYPVLAGLALLLSAAPSVEANPSSAEPEVVVRVGDSTLTSATIAERYAGLPAFQREKFGTSTEARALGYVDQVLVFELLLSEEGKRRKLTQAPEVRWRVQSLLAHALEDEVRAAVEDGAISDDQLRDYFDKHNQKLGRPRALRLFRLLSRDRVTAEKLLKQAKGITDMADWRQLVREHSVDQATKLRGGDLGFVHADGNTMVPRVRVSKQLFEAAEQVKDGELVDRVVPDEDHFAVVWRRGTLGAHEPSFEDEAPRIRQLLVEQEVERRMQSLVEELAKGRVTRENANLLDELRVTTPSDPRLAGSAFRLPSTPPKAAQPAAAAPTNR